MRVTETVDAILRQWSGAPTTQMQKQCLPGYDQYISQGTAITGLIFESIFSLSEADVGCDNQY